MRRQRRSNPRLPRTWGEESPVPDENEAPMPDPDAQVDDVVDEAEPIVPPPAVEPAAGPPTLPPNDPPRHGIVGP